MSGWRGGGRWRGDPEPGEALELGAQLGRIADAVEVWDPSGLLVDAVDTPDGVAVQLGVGEGEATPDPGTALGWSVPLRDVAGARIAAIDAYTLEGYVRALIWEAPAGFATPSNLYVFAGVTTNGPLSTATRGFIVGVQNTVASRWAAGRMHLATTWAAAWATGQDANTYGAHGAWGGPALTGADTFGMSAVPIPIAGATASTSTRAFSNTNLTGNDPHLVFGVGWAGTPAAPDAVLFSPRLAALPPEAPL